MRSSLSGIIASSFLLTSVSAQGQDIPPTNIVADPAAPKGKLPGGVTPTAYRLDFTILPEADGFTGHDEIDVSIKSPTSRIYLHGRDLSVTKVVARVAGTTVPARFTQVDETGTARIDFDRPVPAGIATLLFDYSGRFNDGPTGLFHVKVDGKWYSWTQFESIDARAAYPSFDEPGFKQPFTLTVTTHSGMSVITNALETSVVTVGAGLEKHSFAQTRPLPTYLVAVDTGPFVHQMGVILPTRQRAQRLPYGAVATQPQQEKMSYVMAETPRIISVLEKYFGTPFPFSKLDQIGTPVMPGAMENAGADTYGDGIIFLGPDATTAERQDFGWIVAHELSHQWFGDLVTPAWWDDIWLNESFANWMGYRAGSEWRPELHVGLGALVNGFSAMNIDALEVGRPIHQRIDENGQIDSAFDVVTYGKGGHVVAMIAAYLGDERFKQGVRLHLKRHAYGSATSEQFFESIADAAQEPKVLAAFRSFVDQPGVPLVEIRRRGTNLVASQSRYALLGSTVPPLAWTIPICVRVDRAKRCILLEGSSITIHGTRKGVIMPNVGGTGYYRFNLAPDDWAALIGVSGSLSPGEALATTDSLWGAFTAGRAPAAWLIAEAKAVSGNSDATASIDPGLRFARLRRRGFIAPETLGAYRRFIGSLYGPQLAAVGFDPALGTYRKDDPDRQRLREGLVSLEAQDARDLDVRAKLKTAASRYLAGDGSALDPAFRAEAFTVMAQDDGLPTAKMLVERALSSEDTGLRADALAGVAASGRAEVAGFLLALMDKRLRILDRRSFWDGIIATVETQDLGIDWLLENYAKVAAGSGGNFIGSGLPQLFAVQCGAAQAARIDESVGPAVRKANVALLSYQRTLESIRHCGVLRQAAAADLATALAQK